MGLPKIDQPLFPITIPSTGKKTKFRPFTVKEEKILLIAQESKEMEQIVLAVKQIMNNCVVDIDVDCLAMVDLEYVLLKIRAKSVGNTIEFEITDPETEQKVKLKTDVDQIEVVRKEDHKNTIDVGDRFKLIMRYPYVDDLLKLKNDGRSDSEKLIETMLSCVEMLVSSDGDEVYKLSEFTEEEVAEFLESLSSSTVFEIQKFFESAPVLRIEIPYTNSKGSEKKYVLEGLESFFI